jgi:hypothetical protein
MYQSEQKFGHFLENLKNDPFRDKISDSLFRLDLHTGSHLKNSINRSESLLEQAFTQH